MMCDKLRLRKFVWRLVCLGWCTMVALGITYLCLNATHVDYMSCPFYVDNIYAREVTGEMDNGIRTIHIHGTGHWIFNATNFTGDVPVDVRYLSKELEDKKYWSQLWPIIQDSLVQQLSTIKVSYNDDHNCRHGWWWAPAPPVPPWSTWIFTINNPNVRILRKELEDQQSLVNNIGLAVAFSFFLNSFFTFIVYQSCRHPSCGPTVSSTLASPLLFVNTAL